MTDRPTLFSGPMVRALLAGTKSQTRRIMPHQDSLSVAYAPIVSGTRIFNYAGEEEISRAPYATGDSLYVRETFSGPHGCRRLPPRDWPPTCPRWYWADGDPVDGDWTKPKPGMHMPRWASRLTLTVTDVRVQRLQEISEIDAICEGCTWQAFVKGDVPAASGPVMSFAALWDGLNEARGYGWDVNPWVSATTFTVHHANIDATPAEAA